MSILGLLLFFALWVFVQVYILPKLGISTWLRDSCQLGKNREDIQSENKKINAEW